MAQYLRALATPPDNPGFIPNMYMVALNCNSSSRGSDMPSSTLEAHSWNIDIHASKVSLTYNKNRTKNPVLLRSYLPSMALQPGVGAFKPFPLRAGMLTGVQHSTSVGLISWMTWNPYQLHGSRKKPLCLWSSVHTRTEEANWRIIKNTCVLKNWWELPDLLLFLLYALLVSSDKVSPCSLGWPGTCCLVQAAFEYVILLPQSPKC